MDNTILKSLELMKDSSDRARTVLLFMQVACIVVFMASWHETGFSWTLSRLRTAQAAAYYFDCVETHLPTEKSLGLAQSHDVCHYVADASGKRNPPFSETDLQRAQEYIRDWRLTPAQARRDVQNLQDSVVNRAMNITAPLLGFSFDINDLGLIGGLSLLFLLLWLYFSLRREEENIRLLFANPKAPGFADVYQLASMTQVFTIPPDLHTKRASRVALNGILQLLYLTPLAAQGFVLFLDFRTRYRGLPVGDHLVINELLAGSVIWLLMFICTWLCWQRVAAIDRHWLAAARAVPSAPPPANSGERASETEES